MLCLLLLDLRDHLRLPLDVSYLPLVHIRLIAHRAAEVRDLPSSKEALCLVMLAESYDIVGKKQHVVDGPDNRHELHEQLPTHHHIGVAPSFAFESSIVVLRHHSV